MTRTTAGGRIGDRMATLTERQREVLDLIAAGKTNAEIGESLGISLDGAKWHVSEILGKLGVATREEAADAWRAERSVGRRVWRGLALVRWGTGLRIAVGAAALVAVVSAVLAVGILHDRRKGIPDAGDPTLIAGPGGPPSPTPAAPAAPPATFLFSPVTLDSRRGGPADPSPAERIRSIRAFVGDVECDRVSLVHPAERDALGNAPLVVGLAGQPAPCHIAGATVTFVMARGFVMFVQGTVEPGTTTTIENLAPNPPHSPMYPAEETILFFALPNFLGASGHADPLDVTVFADGERCTRVGLADGGKVSAGYVAVPLGRPGQPAACSRPGANVVGYDQDGNQLSTRDDTHALAPLTWMYVSGEADPGAPKRDPSELGPVEIAWP